MIVKLEEVRLRKQAEFEARKAQGKARGDFDFEPLAWDYGEVNGDMSKYWLAPLQVENVNAVFIHKSKPEWKDNKPTGGIIIDCWKGTPGAVQVTAQIRRDPGPGGTGSAWKLIVNTCRLDVGLEGQMLPEASYDYLAAVLNIERKVLA